MEKLKAAVSPRKSSASGSTSQVSRRTIKFKRKKQRALKEIKLQQASTKLIIPKATFCRLVKEIITEFTAEPMRIQSQALEALQEAVEMYITQYFEDSYLCSIHAKRVTLQVGDVHLMRRLRGPNEVANR